MKCIILLLALAITSLAGTFTGVITDSMCGVSHEAMKMGPDADCVKACVKDHNSKYALLVGTQVYKLSDQQTPEKFAAQKVTVVGTLDAKTKAIKVQSIAPAK